MTPSGDIFFRQLEVGPMQNFVYIIGCPHSKKAAVIDCGFEPEIITASLDEAGYSLEKILLTHFHYDHTGAADQLGKQTGAKIFAHPNGENKRGKVASSGMWIIPQSYQHITEGDTISLGNLQIDCLLAPGHQSDHLLYVCNSYLFTGDTLFIEKIGRTDLPDANPIAMENSLNKIIAQNGELIVCPGHDYGSVTLRKLKYEIRKNPYLMRLV
jgi:glyoxylase-like metal-dependent hydrolase (beta-lactamase superfamily II)